MLAGTMVDSAKAILGRYAESKRWVVDRYFPGTTGLFNPPQEDDYDYSTPHEMQAQQVGFLATMLYQMNKKGKQ